MKKTTRDAPPSRPGDPFLHRLQQECFVHDRLCDVVIEAGCEISLPVTRHRVRRECDDRKLPETFVGTNSCENLVCRHLLERNIEKHEGREVRGQPAERVRTIL